MKNSNKKADSRLLSPWLFIVLGIIGVAIAVGVFSYYSGTMDIRPLEAKTLSDKLVYGLSEDGYLKEGVIGGGYDIFSSSKIFEKALDNSGKFYFNVSMYNDQGKLEKEFIKGNIDFEIQCRLKGDKLAKCYYRELILVDKKDLKPYKIKILAGSNNGGKLLSNEN